MATCSGNKETTEKPIDPREVTFSRRVPGKRGEGGRREKLEVATIEDHPTVENCKT